MFFIKFGETLSICSQDIEQKRYFGVNQGPSMDPEGGGGGGGGGDRGSGLPLENHKLYGFL